MNDIVLNKLKDYTLLFVENEKSARESFEEFFNLLFKEVFIAVDEIEAFELYRTNKPDLIIADIKMENTNEIELIQKIRKEDKEVSIVITSTCTDVEFLLSCIPLNLIEYIVKPLNEKKLLNMLELFLENSNTKPTIDLVFDKNKNQTRVDDKVFDLSLKESLFLQKLIDEDRIITYNEIECDVWDGKQMSQNALRLFVKNFRKKLPKGFIRNVSKQGYIINKDKLKW